MKRIIITVLGLGLTFAARADSLLGQTIGIDFGTVDPASSENFNAFSDVTIANGASESFPGTLIDTDGVAVSGIGFSVSNATGQASGRATASPGAEGYGVMTDRTVYSDWLISNSTSGNPLDSGGYFVFTFSGLDDSLAYELAGGFDSNNDNFDAIWSADGQKFATTPNGDIGYGTLTNLFTDGAGNLKITVTRNTLHVTAAALTLTAVTPVYSAPADPPELPDGVSVIFDPTDSETAVTGDDLNYMTVGGSWQTSFSGLSRFDANMGGYLYVMDESSAQGDSMELTLDDGGLDFSDTAVAIRFEMLATRDSVDSDKAITLMGYDGSNEIFRLNYVSNPDNELNTITVVSDDGDESMGFTPLCSISEASTPSGLQDFCIVLSDGTVTCSGSSLTLQEGGVLNNAQTLTSLRWEITGSNAGNQGFWLDDIQIRHGLPEAPRRATDRPNIIFVLMDDMGYSDISCYGATLVDTPNVDALAEDGLQFTTFLAGANVCSPSRAAFLTGAYPQRCGIPMAVNEPLQNHWFLGLDPDEITLAEQCRKQGYKTFMVGKWHLGTEDVFLPLNQGFDHWLGTSGNEGSIYDDTEVAYSTFPQSTLTSLYTQRVREHIRQSRDQPFFLYYAHNYPHKPYTEGNAFDGATGNGTRSDVIKEVDWSIGQMVAELEAQGILDNTLIIFSSDNGAVPPSSYANAPFRGSKYVTYDGGHRVPFILYWNGQIQTPSELDAPQVWAMDLFSTVSELIGAEVPDDRVYDGTSLVPLLSDGAIDRDEDAPFYYYSGDNLQCVRMGDWKLDIPRTEYQLPWWDQIQPPPSTYSLYDMSDPAETDNLADAYPEIVATMSNLAANIVLELGNPDPDTGIMVWGSGQRGTGTLFPEVPTILNNESDYSYVPDWNTLTDIKKGRGMTREGMDGVVDVANEFIDESAFPYGWQYLEASDPVGGIERAMTSNTVVGSEGNSGFSGTGSAGLIGSSDAGAFVIESTNTANAAVEGTDLLVVTDEHPDRDYVIVRYTIDANDVSFGKTTARISGSFRDLVGGISDSSVTVYVYHNNVALFSAVGASGRLQEAAGTFDLSDVTVGEGDTISFVVGSNGSSAGDEVALKAALAFEVSADSSEHVATLESGIAFSGGTASLQFHGTAGLGYVTEWTSDLSDSNSWEMVDELPFLPSASYAVYLETIGNQGFWRIRLAQ